MRNSTAFAAFRDEAANLRDCDLETLAELEDAQKHEFWVNVHNLCVLHAVVAEGFPPTHNAFASLTGADFDAVPSTSVEGGILTKTSPGPRPPTTPGRGASGTRWAA